MIVEDLKERGYSVQEAFLSLDEVRLIQEDMQRLYEAGSFKAAGIGNNNKATLDESVRSDKICWFDLHSLSSSQQIIVNALEKIRLACNQHLFLGLLNFEGHYSIYLEDSFYGKHVDSFKDDDSRALSAVLYFNESWKKGDGGELMLHCQPPVIVEPRAGTLVLFLSREIEHEVLRSKQLRKSFAGWFKKRTI